MIQSISKVRIPLLGFFLLFTLAFVSCDQEDTSILEIENFSDSIITDLQSRTVGKNYCLEFVFPLNIAFIDGSVAEVTDYEHLHETIKAFFTDNDLERTKENKPTIVFPIEVVNQDGEIIQVGSYEDLKELKSECPKEGKRRDGHRGKGHKCFDLVFPISVTIAEDTLIFDDKESLKAAIRAYKEAAGEDAERPELVFPINVQYDDGTVTEVSSKEELGALKEACKSST